MFGRQPHAGFSHEANIKQLGAAALPFISTAFTVLSSVGGLLQKGPKAPKDPSAPTPMPTEDSALVAEAKRRTLVAQAAKGGRTSTVLTDDGDDSFGGN